jgi:4,5-dihydroxyphthalate decarboxylase
MKIETGLAKFALVGICVMATAPFAAAADNLPIRIATLDHPHVRAIQDGSVPISGCSVALSTLTIDALRAEMSDSPRYDVLEIELLPYLRKKAAGELQDYTLLPIFLMRDFQLRHVYVRSDREIHSPTDLRGKKIGVADYAGTTPTWVRGILQSSWSVHADEITWVDTLTTTAPISSLSSLLANGQVDAIISVAPPENFGGNRAHIVRLFPDYKATEEQIFQATRIFPVLTALAVRKELVDKNAWLPETLFDAFSIAKKKAYENKTMRLPWEGIDAAATTKIMGRNYWSYGVKANPKTLGALFRYAGKQKLLPETMKPEDVFDLSAMLLLEP